jgi:hypothetical protein
MSFIRRASSTNSLVAIFLLVILSVIAGPSLLPNVLHTILPSAYETTPCEWLRTGEDRAEHQSLIGRNVANALSLRVRTTAVPQTPDQHFRVNIILTNNSIGTIAIVYGGPQQVRIGDDGISSGLGLVFNSTAPIPPGQGQTGFVPESEIRLLGPRQSCLINIEYPTTLPDPRIATGTATVKAYYRNTSRGTVQPVSAATPIFPDQGLWVGVAESVSVPIPIASS